MSLGPQVSRLLQGAGVLRRRFGQVQHGGRALPGTASHQYPVVPGPLHSVGVQVRMSSDLCFLPKAGSAKENNGHRLEMERQPSASCSFTSEAPHRGDCSVEPSGGGSLTHSTCVRIFILCEGRGQWEDPILTKTLLGPSMCLIKGARSLQDVSHHRSSSIKGLCVLPPSASGAPLVISTASPAGHFTHPKLNRAPLLISTALRTLRRDADGPPAPDLCGSG